MKTIISILTVLGFAFGAWFYIDKEKADCKDVQMLAQTVQKNEKAFEYHQTREMYDRKQQQELELDLKYPNKDKMSPEMRKLYEEIKKDKKEYQRQLEQKK